MPFTHQHYKPAQLYSAKHDLTKEWYVEYSFKKPGGTAFQRIKERFDINRIPDLHDRLTYGKALVVFLNEKLSNGFNPYTAAKHEPQHGDMRIRQQLHQLKTELCNGARSHYASATFTENYNRLHGYLEEKKISGTIYDFEETKAKKFKKYLLEKGLSQKTINATISYLCRFWNVAIEKKWTFTNPFKALPKAKKQEAKNSNKVDRFEPLTSEELDKIFPHLRELGEDGFILFLSFIFYAFARPIEITRLRVQDIELRRQVIRFKQGETKNDNAAYVQIVPPLMKLLQDMNFHQYPGHYYIFGNDFKPSATKQTKYFAGQKWLRIVKQNLQINKDMYALKHTGNIEYLLNNRDNINLKWQQTQNRHSSSAMTDRYNRKLGAFFANVEAMNFRHFE